MGILAQFFNTTIINTAHHFNLERDQAKNIKTEIIKKSGVQRFWFILDYLDFYYYWNLILLNEPPYSKNLNLANSSQQ